MSDWREELLTRLQPLKLSPEQEAGIAEELGHHLDDRSRELVAGGMTADDARRAALADLDAPGELARRLHEVLDRPPLRLPPPGAPARGRWFAARWQDVGYSIRSLRRSPAFTGTVIASLALTIGPTTAMLSIGNWLLWRPTPGVVDPERIGMVSFGETRGEMTVVRSVSYPNLDDLRRTSRTFTAIAGVLERPANIAADDLRAEIGDVGWVTADFFDAVGVRIAAGRGLLAADDRWPAGAAVAVVSDGLAYRAFGSPAGALEQRLLVNGQPVTVVGVVAPGFTGTGPLSRVDAWMPGASYAYANHYAFPTPPTRGDALFSEFLVRLAPGATGAEVQAELDVLVPALALQYPGENDDLAKVRSSVTPGLGLIPRQRTRYQELVTILVSIGAVLLVLGCANVANLLTARGLRRHRERVVRLALGASRSRLAMLSLTESVLLAVAGAAAGVLLAIWLKEFVVTMLMPAVSRRPDFAVPLDYRVLALTLAVSIGCGLIAGLAPAIMGAFGRAIRTPILATPTGHRTSRRLRSGFAAAQLALSLALVTAAFLLVATLQNLSDVDLGFDFDGVSAHHLDASRQGYPAERRLLYYREIFDRLRSGPWTGIALSDSILGSNSRIRLQDPAGGEQPLPVWANAVSASYFDVLSIRVVAGRPLTDAEAFAPAGVSAVPVVITEPLARRAFGDTPPIGRRLVLPASSRAPSRDLTVVGVVAGPDWDLGLTSYFNREGGPRMEVYLPFTDASVGLRSLVLLIKSTLPIRDVQQHVEEVALAVDSTLPIRFAGPADVEIAYRLADRITFAWVTSLLGWLGFVLAAVGLYGLLAQSVTERTREFGIRMAVGGARAHIFGLVIRQAAWIGGIGAVAGLGLAFWGSRLIEAQLFGVDRTSAGVYLASALALGLIVLLAGLWPARTATRIDPVEALRTE